MNKIIALAFLLLIVLTFSCNSKSSIKMIDNVEEAIRMIEEYEGDVNDFELPLKEQLTIDGEILPNYIAKAVLTNAIIKKGWTFNGSDSVSGGKVYKYKLMEN